MPVYLKYGDIRGDASEPAHRSWIELTSAQFGHDKSKVSDIIVTKMTDSASAGLFRESVSGQSVDAVIDFVRDEGTVYLRIKMTETLISAYSISGSGENATESITLNFTKLEFENNPGTPPP